MSKPAPIMDPLTELTSITHILHLTHHRNHNQHRLAKWYKAFSLLRRSVSKLQLELLALNTALSMAASASNKYVAAAREKVEARVEFMRRYLLPRCYVAFGNLVADNRYAVLGLMLMGTLARVRSVLLLLGMQEEDVEETIEGEVGIDALEMEKDIVEEQKGEEADLDLGEVVRREEVRTLVGGQVEEEGGLEERQSSKRRKVDEDDVLDSVATKSTPIKLAKKKKKRKKGDTFDDLFDSLI